MAHTSRDEAYAALTTTPGSEFELVHEPVLGTTVQTFANLPPNLQTLFEQSVEHGERPYLIAGDRSYSFVEHHRITRNLSRLLIDEYGIAKGDRVAIFSFNRPEWIIAFWAITTIGAVAVAGNSMGVARELQHQIDLTDTKLVLSDTELSERLRECDLSGRLHANLIDLVDRAENAPGTAPAVELHADLDHPAVIIFTSGTTGRPKGATHSHRNVITAVWFHRLNDAIAATMGTPPQPRRFLLASPMFHIASLHNLAVVRLVTGDTAVMLLGRFDPSRALELIRAHRITNWGAVPTMISRILREDLTKHDLSSLKVLTINSAPSSPSLQEEARTRLPHVAKAFGSSYGLTESSTAVSIATPEMFARNPESVGKPIVTMDVEIRDADGNPAPEEQEGEIYIRGPLVMLGYWGEDRNEDIDADGWFATGDLGYFSKGELHIRSRRTDLILRGAQNIYPAEVENIITDFPGVLEAHVAGVPDDDYGEAVAAFVVVKDPESFDRVGLVDFLDRELARYKRPSFFHVTSEELPKNATGKVMQQRLDFSVLTRAFP